MVRLNIYVSLQYIDGNLNTLFQVHHGAKYSYMPHSDMANGRPHDKLGNGRGEQEVEEQASLQRSEPAVTLLVSIYY